MSDFPGAIDYFVDKNRVFPNQNTHSAIVLHGTGGNANQTVEQLGDWFRKNEEMASTHYGIGRDGRIAQYVLESDGAAGNGVIEGAYDPFWDQFPGNKNKHVLSVETINDAANSLPLTEPQEQTLFKLVKHWVVKYNIPLTHIKGHFSLQPVNRARCPGPNFPWEKLFNYLKGNMMNIPQGWTDDGKTLRAPNGVTVTLGFRDYVLSHNWHKDNWPLEAERHFPILEQSNPGIGSGQAQIFRRTRLSYTPKMSIFEGWLGQELLWYQKDRAQLQKQIADLNKSIEQLQANITALQSENDQIKALLASSNLGQINTIGKRIAGDTDLILKMTQVQ